MERFRYPQFCPLARAAELLGQRWTLLVLRELMLGPQRFSDLRRRLAMVSPSVLAERLAGLEEAGILSRRELPPPAASTVYELTELGRASQPLLVELMRWGLRLMTPPRPGDQLEPDWLRLLVLGFGRRRDAPPRRLALQIEEGERGVELRIAGGTEGTRLLPEDAAVEATLRGSTLAFLAVLSGRREIGQALREGALALEGDAEAAHALPRLFDMDLVFPEADATPSALPPQKGMPA